jgi:hypothetical protein
MPRNETSFFVRLLWAGFGLTAGSALVLAALMFGLGAWRLSTNYSCARRRVIRGLIVLHGFFVTYASGLLLIWLTILLLQF